MTENAAATATVTTPASTVEMKPAGAQVLLEDITFGMQMACLAITDDKPGTLHKIGKLMPWQVQAVKIITGSKAAAQQPLSMILKEHFQMSTDHIINTSGWAGRYPIDTQGFIAHDHEKIVLSFRCTTSLKDWMTNLAATSSAWEPELDTLRGHSGHLSCIDGLCCAGDEYKPRVHTGFYNNFLATMSMLKEHIDPLLAPDQPPRKLYVVGHSLGAGIATMATCYYVLNFDWENLPHRLISVTAGSPRACMESMRDVIRERIEKLGTESDKIIVCRVQRDRDVVPSVPPVALGFAHLDTLVYISENEDLVINPKFDVEHRISPMEIEQIDMTTDDANSTTANTADDHDWDATYEKKIAKFPRSLRDHMPEFYLTPLLRLVNNQREIVQSLQATSMEECKSLIAESEKPKTKTKSRSFFGFFGRKRKERKVANVCTTVGSF